MLLVLLAALGCTREQKPQNVQSVQTVQDDSNGSLNLRGYALARSWTPELAREKIDAADKYYADGGLALWGKTRTQQSQLRLNKATYSMCVDDAQSSKLGVASSLGPQHLAECDRVIDETHRLIAKQEEDIKREYAK